MISENIAKFGIKMLDKIKWATRQRLQFIEFTAYYCGLITRSSLAETFRMSNAAATKDLSLYNELAPQNLRYQQSVFGFIPTPEFQTLLADLSPARVLPLLESGLPGGTPSLTPPGYTPVLPITQLELPRRYPRQTVLAQITRAIRGGCKLRVDYHSLSRKKNASIENSETQRIIEPHSLANTGTRWHVRAYNNVTWDFRDFVLSRFAAAECLEDKAESSEQYDEMWTTRTALRLRPHPGLDAQQRTALLMDYNGSPDGVITVPEVRCALLGYALQALNVDTSADYSGSPLHHPFILDNRADVEIYAAWVFKDTLITSS